MQSKDETAASLPRPTAQQLEWHRMEFYGFIHFGINTFTDQEWGYGDQPPERFDPRCLSPQQWAEVATDAGMQGLILTCKHHDGFCLWPSRYTEYSLKNSPYKGGTGDVVGELSEACRQQGLKFGVYLSPWDRHHHHYGGPEYIRYYRNQMQELLTQYGPIFEVWLDGANGGDGYYGGANETRTIDRSAYYQWPATIAQIRQLQPDALIFSDAGPDIRWIGNERGMASASTWYTFDPQGRYPGYSPPGYDPAADLGQGHQTGRSWIPPEADVSIRPGWFYHEKEDSQVKDGRQLMELYYQSVGRGANLLLNLPPDRSGCIPQQDIAALQEFRRLRQQLRDSILARVPTASASSGSNPAAVCLPSPEQFWQAHTEDKAPWLQLDFGTPVTFDHVILQETIARGQRIAGWQLQAAQGPAWRTIGRGTTIGYKRLQVLPEPVRTDKLRLLLAPYVASPALSYFAVADVSGE